VGIELDQMYWSFAIATCHRMSASGPRRSCESHQAVSAYRGEAAV